MGVAYVRTHYEPDHSKTDGYGPDHQSYSPVVKQFAWLWWSPTASEALSYGLNF